MFLAAIWAAYADGRRFGRESGGLYHLVDADHRFPSIATSRLLLRDRLIAVSQTLSRAGKAVVLIEQTPEMGFDAGRCARLLTPAEAATRCAVPRATVMNRQRNAEAIIAAVRVAASGLRVVDPRRVLCDADWCYAVRNGESLYGDFQHLSDEGSEWVVPLLLKQVETN